MTVRSHHLLRLGQTHFFISLHMVDLHARIKTAGTDTHKSDTVSVCLVHIGLDFENKSRKILFHRIDDAHICLSRQRRISHLQEMFQESLHTEVGQSRSEKYGRQLTFADSFLVKLCAGTVQQFDFLFQLFLLILVHYIQKMRIVKIDLFLQTFLRTLHGIGESQYFSGISVIDTAEFLTGTDGPVDGTGGDPQLLLDIVQQIKGIVGIPVHLVDKCKNRNMTHNTDLKQLSCLRLYTFGCIDHHNSRIGGHQSTVCILREVLMAGRIQNIDAVAIIIKLQYG